MSLNEVAILQWLQKHIQNIKIITKQKVKLQSATHNL